MRGMSTAARTSDALTTFDGFEAEARRRGFDEVIERAWPAGQVLDTHTHDFAVWAQVSRGEMWLTVGGETKHLLPGMQFALEAKVPHAERYGSNGAAYWVARRHVD